MEWRQHPLRYLQGRLNGNLGSTFLLNRSTSQRCDMRRRGFFRRRFSSRHSRCSLGKEFVRVGKPFANRGVSNTRCPRMSRYDLPPPRNDCRNYGLGCAIFLRHDLYPGGHHWALLHQIGPRHRFDGRSLVPTRLVLLALTITPQGWAFAAAPTMFCLKTCLGASARRNRGLWLAHKALQPIWSAGFIKLSDELVERCRIQTDGS